MNNIDKILVEKELSKLVIDLVWSATDGGCKLKESDFSHFEEPLYEWTALVNKFSTSIHQAIAEERERVVGEIKKYNQERIGKYWEDKNNKKSSNEVVLDILSIIVEVKSLLDKPLPDNEK